MRADGSDIYSVTYRDPKDRVNIFEELLTRVMAKTINFIIPNSNYVGDGWGITRQGGPYGACGVNNLESYDHMLVKEDLDKRPRLRVH